MLSRRTFLVSAATSLALAPHIGTAVTEAPRYTQWPQIQGPSIDPQRTRFIRGAGLHTDPVNTVVNRPDLSFVQNLETNPSMVLTSGVVMARALGPSYPLVAIDAVTGEPLWERERVERILGVFENLVFVIVSPDSPTNYPILKAILVDRPTDLWAAAELEVAGSVVVPDQALIYSRIDDDRLELVSRELRNGKLQWSVDITDHVDLVPAVFATNGEVVVGTNDPVKRSTHIYAWSVETGELVWQHTSPHFLSSPAFSGDDLIIATVEGVQRMDASTGEMVAEVPLPQYNGGLVKLAITSDALILVDSERIHSINWDTGVPNWSRAPLLAASTRDLLVCGGLILRIEDETATSFRQNSVRGYSLEDGRLVFDYRPVDFETNEVNTAAFLVAKGNLYMATNKGLGIWFPGEAEAGFPNDPMMDRTFANEEYGFSYSWDEEWEALGSIQLTPNGLILWHAELDRYVAQSAGPESASDRDFTRAWHAVFGAYDNSILEINPVEAPRLDFVPDNAEVLAVVYRTTLQMPADLCFGVRVLIPLTEGQRLLIEYLQDGVPFEDKIDSFATFFENLVIG